MSSLRRRCWFQRVSPAGPKKLTRILLSTPCVRQPNLPKYVTTSPPIRPDDPVTNNEFILINPAYANGLDISLQVTEERIKIRSTVRMFGNDLCDTARIIIGTFCFSNFSRV